VILISLIRLLTMQPPSAAQSTAELLLTRGAVVNALAMARDEMRIVQGLRPEIKEAVQSFVRRRPEDGGPGQIRAYWGKGETDGWTPSWIRTQVEEELRLERMTLPADRNELLYGGDAKGSAAAGTTVAGGFSSALHQPAPSLRSRSSSMHLGGSPRRRTSTLILHNGLAHALEQNGSPTQVGGGTSVGGAGHDSSEPASPAPSSSMRLRRLSSAIAKRHFDGSITLERALFDSDDEDDNHHPSQHGGTLTTERQSTSTNIGGVRAASVLGSLGVDEQAIVFDDPEEFSSSDEAAVDAAAAGKTEQQRKSKKGEEKVRAGRLTSTVCEVGMPHAFCLTFGTEMGNIVAKWIQQDYYQ